MRVLIETLILCLVLALVVWTHSEDFYESKPEIPHYDAPNKTIEG